MAISLGILTQHFQTNPYGPVWTSFMVFKKVLGALTEPYSTRSPRLWSPAKWPTKGDAPNVLWWKQLLPSPPEGWLYGFVWKCWVNIPNEIAIFHRDNDHQPLGLGVLTYFQTHPNGMTWILSGPKGLASTEKKVMTCTAMLSAELNCLALF